MKNSNDIYTSLKTNLEDKLNDQIQTGSVIDIYNKVLAEECEDMYEYIEANKNPYLFTNTFGDDLDSLGYWVNLSREENEDDEHYKYRLKDWLLTVEASNTTALSNELLKAKNASNIQYIPYTYGSGTGTCYVIPKTYNTEDITAGLQEAKELIKNVVSPSLYVEYIVPSIRGVKLNCFLKTSGDEATIKNNIETKIKTYINSIAPKDMMQVGEMLRLGINEAGVEYFNIVSLFIDDEQVIDTEIIQELETKLLFDEIIWYGEV